MKLETNIKNNQKKILFIDRELLPIFGFKSIIDYEHLITQKSLNKNIIEKINELLPKITELFSKKLFNLHKTDNKVQTTKQSFNLLKKCLTDANIPYSEWTKRVDDKNINYMRLETINNVLYDYIKNMQEIQQNSEVQRVEITVPLSVHKIPEKKVCVSELYKKAKSFKEYENMICDFHKNENGKIRINMSELFIEETCDKSISLQFIEKEKYFTMNDKYHYDTTPIVMELVSGHDEYLLIKKQNYKPGTNILPENTVIPFRNLCYQTTHILVTPPKNMDIAKYLICIKTIAAKNKNILTDFYNGKFQLIFDTFKTNDSENMGCFFENGRLSPINLHSIQPQQQLQQTNVLKPKELIKFHVSDNGDVTTYNEDICHYVTADIRKKQEMFGELIHKGKYNILKFNNILDTNRIIWHKLKCIDGIKEIIHEMTYCETTNIHNFLVQNNCIKIQNTIRHSSDTCSGIIFCFEKDLGDVSFDITTMSETQTLKYKKITNDEYKNEFHSDSPFGDAGVNYKVLGINTNNQVCLINNVFYETYIYMTISKEQMKSLMREFCVIKSYMSYWGDSREKVAQSKGLIINVFSDVLNDN